MKAGDNRRHKASRNTRPHPDIDLPGQLALPLANVILRRAQLFQNQPGALLEALTTLG